MIVHSPTIAAKVLVTGATGCIGRHALPLLKQRFAEVHAISSKLIPGGTDGICWHSADLLSPTDAVEVMARVRPTHLLHLAWITTPGVYRSSPENLAWVEASLRLFRSFAEHGGCRLVSAGTCFEYDWAPGGVCAESATPLRPASLYGTCKHALHFMLNPFAAEHGLSAATTRIFWLYGPGEDQRRLVPSIIRPLLAADSRGCSVGAHRRDFLHVRDVAAAHVELLASDVCGPINVGSGQAVSIRDLARLIARRLGQPDAVHASQPAIVLNEPPLVVADTGRLQRELRWKPSMSLEVGLDETIQWWKEHGTSSCGHYQAVRSAAA